MVHTSVVVTNIFLFIFSFSLYNPTNIFKFSVASESVIDVLSSTSAPSSDFFPSNFLFGVASSAYQYEGAYLSDGKGLNSWDTFTHKSPGKITDRSNGDISTDHYHRFLDDIDLMSDDLGLSAYRFSISWARILPEGRYGEVNLAGIEFYNKLIDALLIKGIKPFVTLCHYDIPQELEDRYGGWRSSQIQKDFEHYAEVCFKFFGDRVKHWVTFNEPNVMSTYGYRSGLNPPGRCSGSFGNCSEGDSETEPFVAAHNIILSHGRSVELYRTRYQEEQGGAIGVVLHASWMEPFGDSENDKLAVERAQSFFMNWGKAAYITWRPHLQDKLNLSLFLDPIIFGEYPSIMRTILGSNLPRFTEAQKMMLKKSADFIGVNHYTSYYVKDCMFSDCSPGPGTTWSEGSYQRTPFKNGLPIGEPTPASWLFTYPQGMENIVDYIKHRYNNTPMFITENGYAQESNQSSSENEFVSDFERVEYMSGYLDALLRSIRKGADVRGYFAWSLLDNFEWLEGYTKRFGLYHVDYTTLRRSPKLSVAWYSRFIATHRTRGDTEAGSEQRSDG